MKYKKRENVSTSGIPVIAFPIAIRDEPVPLMTLEKWRAFLVAGRDVSGISEDGGRCLERDVRC